MNNANAISQLPPELQNRIASIMAGNNPAQAASQNQPAPQPESAITEAPKPPSLMDHVIALRQEVALLRTEVNTCSQQTAASSQVIEAVGQAVAQLYGMFQPSSGELAQSQTYSQNFQKSVDDSDY